MRLLFAGYGCPTVAGFGYYSLPERSTVVNPQVPPVVPPIVIRVRPELPRFVPAPFGRRPEAKLVSKCLRQITVDSQSKTFSHLVIAILFKTHPSI
ncbi:hypothetical protein DAPPUDRAFT_262486 [Daphnia pulex]|uniref:Uncharacterized protein n=1 Tax=Daphnia pulex TaxID=6669 RepID=E9HN33_DAPPU|nr:hypothetical protein DAPPUDRAFT_262486 [Daphnia pulex]|eukprot:EFX66861.1 hypothetical protein DAPPUDRAFT_262486 [Daphnia pulex]